MNNIPDLTRSLNSEMFRVPEVKVTPRAEHFISELRSRIAVAELSVKGSDRVLQLTAIVGGVQQIVRRIGAVDGNFILLESYEPGAHSSVTLAAVEQLAVTIKIVGKGEKERGFVGVNSFTRPANQR